VDTSICTSTAYQGCQTPYIYIIWIWDEYGLGLQPQSPHFTITYQLRLAQICSEIPKAWSTWAAIRWCGHIHMHIHSISRLSNTFYIYNMDLRWIWVGSTASITSFHHDISAETCPDLWQNSNSLVDMSGRKVVWTHPYAHPQHIKIVKHLLYIYMEVRWIWVGSTASITSFHHDISAETCPDLWQNSKGLVDMSGHNMVWTHPYAHPQHIKVVKQLI